MHFVNVIIEIIEFIKAHLVIICQAALIGHQEQFLQFNLIAVNGGKCT
jgi:predicted RNA methylase